MQARVQRPTGAFIGALCAALLVGMVVYVSGLWNAKMNSSEKGVYAMFYLLSCFAAVAVQKNVRDVDLMSEPKAEQVGSPGEAA